MFATQCNTCHVGYDFLDAGWHKFNTAAWMNGSSEGIIGFWKNALAIPAAPAKPLITFDWYRGFLQFMIDTNSAGWFSYVIVFGELAVGMGLILGAFVGLAAAGGLLMNFASYWQGPPAPAPTPFWSCSASCSSWPGRTRATLAWTTSCCRCSGRRS